MTRNLRAMMLAAVLAGGIGGAASGQQPDAARILEQSRMAATLQRTDLHGVIRKDAKKTKVSLFLRGQDIQFLLGESGTRFHMRLGDKSYDLFEIADGKTKRFDQKRLVEAVAGTDLTYEDLAMRFFYWPNPVLEGSEPVKGSDCYKIRLNNPEKTGDYAVVYVWIHKKFGAFMQVKGYDKQGNLLKEFAVEDVMSIGGGEYTLKKMRVNTMKDGRVAGITYLEFDQPEKVK